MMFTHGLVLSQSPIANLLSACLIYVVAYTSAHNTFINQNDWYTFFKYSLQLSSAGDVGDYKAALELSVSFTLQRLKFDACQTSLAACRLLKLVHEVRFACVCCVCEDMAAYSYWLILVLSASKFAYHIHPYTYVHSYDCR